MSKKATVEQEGGGFDTMFLVHVGLEVVCIGGLAYWLNKRTGELQAQVDLLNTKVAEQDQHLKAQGELLAKHENALQQIFNVMNNRHITGGQNNSVKNQQSPLKKPNQKPQQKNAKKSVKKEQVEDMDDENEDLDQFLGDELAELNCDDSCSIPMKKNPKKKGM